MTKKKIPKFSRPSTHTTQHTKIKRKQRLKTKQKKKGKGYIKDTACFSSVLSSYHLDQATEQQKQLNAEFIALIGRSPPFARGLFGEIYKIEHRDQHYAVKVINLTYENSNMESLTNLCEELEIGMTASYPFMTSIILDFDNGIFPTLDDLYNKIYIPYKLYNTDLHSVVYKNPDFKQIQQHQNDDLLKINSLILLQMVASIYYLHIHGIFHRDVKHGNCLIDTDGFLILSDFGLVSCLEQPEQKKKLLPHTCVQEINNSQPHCYRVNTQPGMIGTIPFMSPNLKTCEYYKGDYWGIAMMILFMCNIDDFLHNYLFDFRTYGDSIPRFVEQLKLKLNFDEQAPDLLKTIVDIFNSFIPEDNENGMNYKLYAPESMPFIYLQKMIEPGDKRPDSNKAYNEYGMRNLLNFIGTISDRDVKNRETLIACFKQTCNFEMEEYLLTPEKLRIKNITRVDSVQAIARIELQREEGEYKEFGEKFAEMLPSERIRRDSSERIRRDSFEMEKGEGY